ncbi:hypothetical protein [Streptomyces syringium]
MTAHIWICPAMALLAILALALCLRAERGQYVLPALIAVAFVYVAALVTL